MAARRFLSRMVYRLDRLRLRITRPLTVGVRVILACEEEGRRQVLLVRHTYHDGWLLPGGRVERGETLEQAARREAREETGAEINSLRLLGVFTNFHEGRSDHIAVFASEDFSLSGAPIDRWEIDRYAFFPLDNLPDGLLRGHRRRLEQFRAGGGEPAFGLW